MKPTEYFICLWDRENISLCHCRFIVVMQKGFHCLYGGLFVFLYTAKPLYIYTVSKHALKEIKIPLERTKLLMIDAKSIK